MRDPRSGRTADDATPARTDDTNTDTDTETPAGADS